jgi:hypothetical protein
VAGGDVIPKFCNGANYANTENGGTPAKAAPVHFKISECQKFTTVVGHIEVPTVAMKF